MIFNPITHPLAYQANIFAAAAHAAVDQKRKYTTEPYIVHPRSVAQILRNYGYDDDLMYAAALLHDVIEDTGVTTDVLHREFHFQPFRKALVNIVDDLTNLPQEFGNRQTRKAEDRKRLSAASPAAQTIKCADILDNITGISDRDPEFGLVYAQEALDTLAVLREADEKLRERAREVAAIELEKCQFKKALPLKRA